MLLPLINLLGSTSKKYKHFQNMHPPYQPTNNPAKQVKIYTFLYINNVYIYYMIILL